jgi:4-hydroxy-3-polyprenylbenzoate decarboxylase
MDNHGISYTMPDNSLDGISDPTKAQVHTKNIETGLRNIGKYRLQIYDDKTTGMHWHRHKTGAVHFEGYKKAGICSQ